MIKLSDFIEYTEEIFAGEKIQLVKGWAPVIFYMTTRSCLHMLKIVGKTRTAVLHQPVVLTSLTSADISSIQKIGRSSIKQISLLKIFRNVVFSCSLKDLESITAFSELLLN